MMNRFGVRIGKSRLFLLGIMIMLWITGGLVSAQETPTATPDLIATAPRGTVTGKVTNGTVASPIPANISVTLLINHDNATVQHLNAQTSADGSFQFADVPIVPGYDYVAAALYRDHIFNSAFIIGSAAVTALELPITVYELTEDPSVLFISSSETRLNAHGSTLEVRQVLQFSNTSDRVFTTSKDLGGGRFGSVLITLPPGAQVVSLDDQSRYIVSTTDFTILDTEPVMPGTNHAVVIAYIIPYDGEAALIEQPFNYPFAGSARLLVSPDSIQIKSVQLPDVGSQPIAETVYKRYSGTLNLKAGDVLRYEVSGGSGVTNISATTAAKVSPGGSSTILFALTALIGVGVAATILAVVLRRRQSQTPDSDQLIDLLTRQIALLDQKHASGQLPHDQWHQQRKPLQARLEDLQGK